MFDKGSIVLYSKTGQKAIILSVHLDDIVPYYTIIINNREIQTVEKYLKKIALKTRRRKKPTRKTLRKTLNLVIHNQHHI